MQLGGEGDGLSRRGHCAIIRKLNARIHVTPRRTMPKVKRSQVDTPAVVANGRPDWIVVVLAAAAVAFSLYLTYLSVFVIGATCPYCLASGVIAVLLLVVMVLRRPRGEGREAAAYKPGKLAALGITAGAFAVLLGAFIFAADFSTPAGYQVALAQHLAKSNATFYGAFW